MTLLKFDPSGCMHPEWGITPEQCESLREPLSVIRDELVAEAERSPNTSFLRLPWQQHSEYQQHREDSLLGRIFRIANSIHDGIDAVVVLGNGASIAPARALMKACCDPYHNELSRAARGSKPRMYFAGGDFDSDAISTLLNRIAAYGDTSVEKRWALIVIDNKEHQSPVPIVMRKFVEVMQAAHGEEETKRFLRYVIPVKRAKGWLTDEVAAIDCENAIDLHELTDPRFAMLSAQSLLPAAMLGLDCMKLLGGAHEMTSHFAESDFAENTVLQFVAVNKLLLSNRGRSVRATKVWNDALSGLASWYESTMPELNFAASPRTTKEQVIHQFVVQAPRCDPLLVTKEGEQSDFRVLSNDAINEANLDWRDCCQPTTKIILPDTEIFSIGELMQFLMIASAVEIKGAQR